MSFNHRIFTLPEGFQYLEDCIGYEKSLKLYKYLDKELNWQQNTIQVFGKTHLIPREECYIADEGLTYKYSGKRMVPEPWPDVLLNMRNRLSHFLNVDFNAVLLNKYRTGKDSMGWHSDDEPELGTQPVIASISLGATRKFKIRHKESGEVVDLMLSNGSCLVMSGNSQIHYQHALPKQLKVLQGRINLTFRSLCK